MTGDIDRGGVFAAMYGTLALLAPEDQALVSGFVINKFRGAPELLDSGLVMLRQLTGRPVYGVLPCRKASAGTQRIRWGFLPPTARPLSITARQPTRSELKIFSGSRWSDAGSATSPTWTRWSMAEPGVLVRFAVRARPTWPRRTWWCCPGPGPPSPTWPGCGTAAWPTRSPGGRGAGRPVLGICGGYQMMACEIDDPVESAPRADRRARACCRCASGSARRRSSAGPRGRALGAPVAGYEIHHGVAEITDPAGNGINGAEPFLDGCRRGAVWGTSWHGALENDEFRRAFLAEVAALAGRDFTPAPGTDFAAAREARLDVLGNLVTGHLDTAALSRLIEDGPVPGLPALVTSLNHDR